MKKLIVPLIILMTLSLTACSSSDETNSQTSSAAPAAAPAAKEEPKMSDKSKSVDAKDVEKAMDKAADKAAESAAGNVTVASGAGESDFIKSSVKDLNMAKSEQTNKLLEVYWTSHIEYAPEIAKELLHPEYLEKGSITIDEQIDSLKSEGAKITFETDGTAARTGSTTLGMIVFVTHPTEGELKYYMTFKETEKKNNEWRISNVKEMEDE